MMQSTQNLDCGSVHCIRSPLWFLRSSGTMLRGACVAAMATLAVSLAACNPDNGHTLTTALDVTPGAITVAQNGTVRVNFSVGPVDPADTVTFLVHGAPDGENVLVSEPLVVGTNVNALVEFKPGTTPAATGKYTLTVEAKSASFDATNTLAMTVDGALTVSLNAGSTVSVVDANQYSFPYTVMATTTVGGATPLDPVASVSAVPSAYQEGQSVFNGGLSAWAPQYSIPLSDPDIDATSFGCKSEDLNGNGVLDPGEDYNGNGRLDPSATVTVTDPTPLDATGAGMTSLSYQKVDAQWLAVTLTAAVEGVSQASTFVLPVLPADVARSQVVPPNATSPFGTFTDCATPN